MAWQRVDDQAKYAVALYDIPEQGNDLKSVYSIMRKAGSTATVRNHRRIGRATPTGSAAGAKRVRPLRVELYSTQERDLLLSLCKKFNNGHSARATKINISPWLQREDAARVKSLRIKCGELNSNSSDKSESYVVRSGRLMLKLKDGTLRAMKADAALTSSSNSPQASDSVNHLATSVKEKTSSADLPSSPVGNQPKNVVVGSQRAP